MMESSGGGCRCACQEDFHDAQDQSPGCCSPHVFTSVLLGILSCVLMTGGVFLAFHRWDPMWLMVSGVGVVLIIIGTILHCCNNMVQKPKRHSSVGKGCCSRPVPPDHVGHMISNNGSLTEQLLPLSNARSVSQLSLNMLPGYFPPVVTAYGIEQHSAVVQNINRLVQQQQQQQQQPQQQQQHLQQAQSPASICPSTVSNAAGKSFIVLSLPGDTSSANIQNLVATVYQLDGNTIEAAANEVIPTMTAPVVNIKPNPPVPLILKNAEVQTCNMWPATNVAATASSSAENAPLRASASSTEEGREQVASFPAASTASCGSTQTDDIIPVPENINLIDCSTDIATICDNSTNLCHNQPSDFNSALVNIPTTSSGDPFDMSLTNTTNCSSTVLVDIPEPPSENISDSIATNLLVDVIHSSTNPMSDCPEILVDISENSASDINSNNVAALLEDLVRNDIQEVETISETANVVTASSTNSSTEIVSTQTQIVQESTNSNLQNINPEILSSTSNLSSADTEIDDGELMARSSPPPSYDDVTLEGESVGAFGLAYGTI